MSETPKSPVTPTDPVPTKVEVKGTQVAYTEEGTGGPPIVLVPGVPGTTRDFRYLAPLIARHRRAIRMEFPGFGSVRHRSHHDYSVRGRGELISGLARALQIDSYLVVGHSMGGPAALAAAACDDRVAGLVLLASVGMERHRGMAMSPQAARRLSLATHVPVAGHVLSRIGARMMRSAGFRVPRDFDPAQFRATLAHVGSYDFHAVATLAAQVTQPTLLAWACDDPQVEPWIGEDLARVLAESRSLVFEEGGHNIQKSHAAELAEEIVALAGGSL